MSRIVAFLDASVLYPAPIRDLLMELAVSDLYRARWSARVHEEWIRAILRTRPDLTRERLVRTSELMDAHVRDALVDDYMDLVPGLALPDPDDRHVLAAAIRGGAGVIVTGNLKDFPEAVLSRWRIVAVAADPFLARLYAAHPAAFMGAVGRVRTRLRHPPMTQAAYRDALRGCGLAGTADLIADGSRPD